MIKCFNSHSCGIGFLKKPKRILFKNNEDVRNLKSQEWESLRIHLDFSNIKNNLGKFSNDDYLDLKDKIMPKTKEILEKLFKVKRGRKNLKLPHEMCDSIEIPDIYLSDGEGVEADIVIFVLIDDTGLFLKQKVEAAAIHCFQDTVTRRPIAGYIMFKPELNISNSTAVDYMVWLAIHEITHILVMNDNLYDDWIDPEGNPYGFNKVVGKKILPNGKAMSYLKTPKILEKGREHYGCPDFFGLPLEYNGGAGTVGAHWSKKYMNTDYMIGDSYGENLISELSLAMFEDSGWYKVDYSHANLFLWGKGKGCDFFNNNVKCIEKNDNKIVTKFNKEFCTELDNPVCSTSFIFRGVCKVRRYENLSFFERYLDDNIAGVDNLTDKCPIPIEVKNGQNYYGGSCRRGNSKNLSEYEKVCSNCACFMSNLNEKESFTKRREQKDFIRFKQYRLSNRDENEDKGIIQLDTNSTHITTENSGKRNEARRKMEKTDGPYESNYKANCIEFKCESSTLFVMIDGVSYKCDKEKIEIEGYDGYLKCPPVDLICHDKFKCKFGCVEKY